MIEVTSNFEINEQEKELYIQKVKDTIIAEGGDPDSITRIILKEMEQDNVSINFYTKDDDAPHFQRIARITGYLTSTVDRWNKAKQAELRDRVAHT